MREEGEEEGGRGRNGRNGYLRKGKEGERTKMVINGLDALKKSVWILNTLERS